jgi:hypothetical protein
MNPEGSDRTRGVFCEDADPGSLHVRNEGGYVSRPRTGVSPGPSGAKGTLGLAAPHALRGVAMKTISWNRKAVEQAKAQGFDNPNHATCPGCGTKPAMGQFGRYRCECGELEGFETGE